ncbi:MAG: hypothetical protein JXL85_02735 [Bacilli bacterium]|nr:hypothetical protein [Bacilli bacterium]
MEKDRNIMWKQVVRFVFLKQNIIISTIILSLFLVTYFVVNLNSNDNNVTWIFSSSMQTLAALIALLPISYSYYIHNMENAKKDDYDGYIIRRLQKDVYYEMMFVIIYSLFVIVFNLFNLYLVYSLKNALITVFFTALAIQYLVIYIYRLFDPERVNSILKDLDKAPSKRSQIKISLDEYITQYLNLETAVKDYISNENDNELIDALPLYDIVDNLSKDFEEINKHYDEFKEIIYHRNNLIHNYHEVEVDYEKYEKILDLISIFEKHNQYFITSNIFNSVSSVTGLIEKTLSEYLIEAKSMKEMDDNYLSDLKMDICSLFHSHFVSDYYFSKSLEEATETDFELIQNNYSNRKIVGIDIRTVETKKLMDIAEPYFKRLSNRFIYLIFINYNHNNNSFDIVYKTKDNKTKVKSIQANH